MQLSCAQGTYVVFPIHPLIFQIRKLKLVSVNYVSEGTQLFRGGV